jgi:hypothetical protein
MTSKTKSSSRQSTLLAAIQRKVPTSAAVAQSPEPTPSVNAANEPNEQQFFREKAERPKSRVGSPVQFWFHEEDRKLLRELAAWIAGQGLRPSDSLVIRAAIRTAKTGGEFLQAYRRASEFDGRLKRHKLK